MVIGIRGVNADVHDVAGSQVDRAFVHRAGHRRRQHRRRHRGQRAPRSSDLDHETVAVVRAVQIQHVTVTQVHGYLLPGIEPQTPYAIDGIARPERGVRRGAAEVNQAVIFGNNLKAAARKHQQAQTDFELIGLLEKLRAALARIASQAHAGIERAFHDLPEVSRSCRGDAEVNLPRLVLPVEQIANAHGRGDIHVAAQRESERIPAVLRENVEFCAYYHLAHAVGVAVSEGIIFHVAGGAANGARNRAIDSRAHLRTSQGNRIDAELRGAPDMDVTIRVEIHKQGPALADLIAQTHRGIKDGNARRGAGKFIYPYHGGDGLARQRLAGFDGEQSVHASGGRNWLHVDLRSRKSVAVHLLAFPLLVSHFVLLLFLFVFLGAGLASRASLRGLCRRSGRGLGRGGLASQGSGSQHQHQGRQPRQAEQRFHLNPPRNFSNGAGLSLTPV